jgi:hypothetical protein
MTARRVIARWPGRALAFLVQIARAFRLAGLVPAHVVAAPLVSVVFWQRRMRAADNRCAPTIPGPLAAAVLHDGPSVAGGAQGAPPLSDPIQGNPGEALALLDTAHAAVIQDRVEQAHALAEIGFQAFRGGDFAHAETQFRRAIVLVSATDAPYLRAALHHSLADALLQQGKNPSEAERHAALALSLRCTLLARIRAGLPSPLSE